MRAWELAPPSPGILTGVVFAGVGIFFTWFHRAIRPPLPKICGSSNGPPVTARRVRLKDGRFLAYKEIGAPRHSAKYKSIFVHGFNGSRHSVPEFSQAFLEENSICVVSFDRAGYGQSDPNPSRQIRSDVHDIEQLADLLQLGGKFHLITESIGGYSGWGCLKYIPHRLSGVGMICPVTNFWWPSFNRQEFKHAFGTQIFADRLFLRVVHHLPWLAYFWMTQPWVPAPSALGGRMDVLCDSDREMIQLSASLADDQQEAEKAEGPQQGIAESLCRDVVVMFANWEFNPVDLKNPYPEGPGIVHIWQGDEDYLVPVTLQRVIHRRLPWIQYHELKGKGHFLKKLDDFPNSILKTLLLEPLL